jgi:SWIM zinc finger
VGENILAEDLQHTTREAIRQAIQQRTTRGMLTFNSGRVHQLEDDLWAVPSTRGGFYQVHLDDEICDCEDYTFFGSMHGVACRHIYAAAIAREKRRLWLRRAARVIAPIFEDEDL